LVLLVAIGYCFVEVEIIISSGFSNITVVCLGNWGCGVFGGNKKLKSIIQLMAAAACNKDVHYFTFKKEKFAAQLKSIFSFLRNKKVAIGKFVLFWMVVASLFFRSSGFVGCHCA